MTDPSAQDFIGSIPDTARVAEPAGAPASFPIVGIGASAGGIEAIGALLSRIAIDSMAFVVIQHLSPDYRSVLSALLAHTTPRMSVTPVEDGTRVEPKHVYVAPEGVDVAIRNGVLHTLPRTAVTAYHSIDFFFRSLADDQRESAIGIVLSGTGTDGTLGLLAIKAEGGLVFVQDVASAKSTGMPQSALDAGCADFSGSPEGIADELRKVSSHPYVGKPAGTLVASPDVLSQIFLHLRIALGNDLTHYKHGTLLRRIERRMAIHNLYRLPDYLRVLQTSPVETGLLYKDILIGVTSFFRDGDPFEALKSTVFPRMLAAKKTGDTIRIWSAGCSTGEEAYSLAICLLEVLGDQRPDFKVQIFATDVDDRAIAKARRGVYPVGIAQDVSAERLERFFAFTDNHYQVAQSVREIVVFATQNILQDAPFPKLDLVSCRNVMIYLQPPLQKKILRAFHYALQPAGALLLGTSETVGDSADIFSVLDKTNKIYSAKASDPTRPPEVLPDRTRSDGAPAARLGPRIKSAPTLEQLADRAVLDSYGPPGVVLNEKLDVVQFRGWTGRYLQSPPGGATFNIVKIARPEIARELRPAIQRSLEEGGPITIPAVTLGGSDPAQTVTLKVVPIRSLDRRVGTLVLFEESSETAPRAVAGDPERTAGAVSANAKDENDFVSTRRYFQSTIEDLESANEGLQATNQDLQSANEEFQSTTEEYQTAKEELQATNEELQTVNDELQARMGDLAQTNDDLVNVLNGVDVALVIVDLELRIRRFTPRAREILGLGPEDVGRPITHLKSLVTAPELEKVVSEVIEHLTPIAQEVRGTNDSWYEMRVVPYQSADHAARGAVLTFEDIDVIKWRVELAHEAHSAALTKLETSPDPTLILNRHLRILWANAVFYTEFAADKQAIVGGLLSEVLGGRFAARQLSASLAPVLNDGTPLRDWPLAGGEGTALLVSAARFPGERSVGPRIELRFRKGSGRP